MIGDSGGDTAATLRRYLPLFETIYTHHLVPACSRNPGMKAIRRPKLHMVDVGLAAMLLGVDADALSRATSTVSGQLLESFVAGELARQLTWSIISASLYQWRDRDGHEVDLVLEASDGRVVGVEAKAVIDVHDRDSVGLRALQRRLGDRFAGGVLLHFGDRPRPFGFQLAAVPIAALWNVAPS